LVTTEGSFLSKPEQFLFLLANKLGNKDELEAARVGYTHEHIATGIRADRYNATTTK
jgi:hypothetical protein